MPSIRIRWHMCQAGAYLHNGTDKGPPFQEELCVTKGTRLKRGKSCLSQAKNTIQSVYDLDDIMPGE